MQRVILALVIAFSLIAQFSCGSGDDAPASSSGDAANSSGSQQSSGAGDRRTARRTNETAGNGEIDLVGEYRYGSDTLGGGTESGRVRISRLGEAYDILMMPTGRPEYYGIGILTGDHLAICYSLAVERGVGSFTIGSDGNLTGYWAVLGSDGDLLEDAWSKVE